MIKLFKNNLFFTILTWFSILSIIPYSISTLILYNDSFTIFDVCIRILVALLLAALYFAYKKNNKNAVFSLIGAILICYVVSSLLYLTNYNDYFVSTSIIAIVSIMLFISTVFVNVKKQKTYKMVAVSQHMALIFAILSFVVLIFSLSKCINTVDLVVTIIEMIASPCCVLSVVCIETNIKSYYVEKSKVEEANN